MAYDTTMIALGKIIKNAFFLALFLAAAAPFVFSGAHAQTGRYTPEEAAQDAEASVPAYSLPATDMPTLKVHVERCNAFENYTLKTLCFDTIVTDMGFKPPAEKVKEKKLLGQFEKWTVFEKANRVGETYVEATLPTNAPLITRDGMERTPELIFSCRPKSTDVFINWNAPLAPANRDIKTLEVVYLFDSDTGIKANWNISLDRYGLFVPRPINFIQSMHGKRILTVQTQTRAEELATMVFTLNGIQDVLKILAERCYN